MPFGNCHSSVDLSVEQIVLHFRCVRVNAKRDVEPSSSKGRRQRKLRSSRCWGWPRLLLVLPLTLLSRTGELRKGEEMEVEDDGNDEGNVKEKEPVV